MHFTSMLQHLVGLFTKILHPLLNKMKLMEKVLYIKNLYYIVYFYYSKMLILVILSYRKRVIIEMMIL